VCDNDLHGSDEDGNPLCPHVPGTRKFLTDDQQDAQRNRGVDDGVATYSIHDATAGEVSAVFDGAVTGAGFRRMLSAYSRGELSGANLAEARLSYGPILAARFDLGRSPKARRRHNPQRSVFVMAKRDKALPGQGILLPDLIDQIRDGEIDPNDITVNLSGGGDDGRSGQGGGNRPAETPETAQLREQLAETNRRLEAAEKRAQKEAEDRLAERRAAALAAVDRDADAAVEANRERLTGETAKTFRAALCQAGRDDLDHPLDGGARRFDQIKALQAGAPAQDVTREKIATSKPEVLPNYGTSGNDSATNLEEDVRAQNAKHMPKGTRIESKAG
jgi:hypothetical protein